MSYCFEITIFAEICIKMCYFYRKIAKIAQRLPCLRVVRVQSPLPPGLRALPPNLHLPAAGFRSQLQMASGSWRLRPPDPAYLSDPDVSVVATF